MGGRACQGTANAVGIYICHRGGVQGRDWQRWLLGQFHCDLDHNLDNYSHVSALKDMGKAILSTSGHFHNCCGYLHLAGKWTDMALESKSARFSPRSAVIQAFFPHSPRFYCPFNVLLKA